METNMEIFPCDNIMYNYLGKEPKGESTHLLIYHCLDVAAVGHVFLQEYDIYLSKMTQATGLDKNESLSLITFYLSMHDLGKFSNCIQNRPNNYLRFHSKMGFHLWSRIWGKIWHNNLLGLDKSDDESESNWKNLFEPWFESVMNHHENKFQYPPHNVIKTYFNEGDTAAACCFVKKSAELLLDNNFEIHKKYYCGMDVSFYSNSKLLKNLTWMSDQTASKHFRYCSKVMPIKEYWDKYAIKRATDTIKYWGEKMSKTFKILPEFSKPDMNIDRIREEVFKRNNASSKYESELRLKLKNDYSLFNPAKKVTSDKTTNEDEIFQKLVDEKFDRCLFEILSCLKKELAKVKPHNRFFPINSLKVMATFFPQDLECFEKIIGINRKYEKIYGELFLEKIVTYCKVNNIEQETNSDRCYPTKLQETLNLCKQNLTLEEIAQKRNLEVNTIIGHIEELILCGADIPMDKFINVNYLERITKRLSNINYKKIEGTIRKRHGDFLTDEKMRFVKAYKIRNDK